MLSCKSCDRAILGAALACAACGALHHEGCHRTAGHCAACASAKPAVGVSVGGRDRACSLALLSSALAMVALVGAVMLTGAPPLALRPPPVQLPSSANAPVLNPYAEAHPRVTSVAGHWKGAIVGNDPHVSADLELSQDGLELDGMLHWYSNGSGRSERRVRGHLDPDRAVVMLHDVGPPLGQPNGTWRFCAVDYYLLDVRDNRLLGAYWSKECSDRARIALTFQGPR